MVESQPSVNGSQPKAWCRCVFVGASLIDDVIDFDNAAAGVKAGVLTPLVEHMAYAASLHNPTAGLGSG